MKTSDFGNDQKEEPCKDCKPPIEEYHNWCIAMKFRECDHIHVFNQGYWSKGVPTIDGELHAASTKSSYFCEVCKETRTLSTLNLQVFVPIGKIIYNIDKNMYNS